MRGSLTSRSMHKVMAHLVAVLGVNVGSPLDGVELFRNATSRLDEADREPAGGDFVVSKIETRHAKDRKAAYMCNHLYATR